MCASDLAMPDCELVPRLIWSVKQANQFAKKDLHLDSSLMH